MFNNIFSMAGKRKPVKNKGSTEHAFLLANLGDADTIGVHGDPEKMGIVNATHAILSTSVLRQLILFFQDGNALHLEAAAMMLYSVCDAVNHDYKTTTAEDILRDMTTQDKITAAVVAESFRRIEKGEIKDIQFKRVSSINPTDAESLIRFIEQLSKSVDNVDEEESEDDDENDAQSQ